MKKEAFYYIRGLCLKIIRSVVFCGSDFRGLEEGEDRNFEIEGVKFWEVFRGLWCESRVGRIVFYVFAIFL